MPSGMLWSPSLMRYTGVLVRMGHRTEATVSCTSSCPTLVSSSSRGWREFTRSNCWAFIQKSHRRLWERELSSRVASHFLSSGWSASTVSFIRHSAISYPVSRAFLAKTSGLWAMRSRWFRMVSRPMLAAISRQVEESSLRVLMTMRGLTASGAMGSPMAAVKR